MSFKILFNLTIRRRWRDSQVDSVFLPVEMLTNFMIKMPHWML